MAEPTQIDAQDTGSHTPRTRLRADAAHNRARIIAAARQLFADRGIDVPMTAIARRAGVGAATLFRRFPDRRSLIDEVFSTQITHCESVLDDAAADPDPWHGFCTFVEELGQMQVEDRGFTEAFLTTIADDSDFDEKSNHAESTFARLAHRAQESGRLRRDFDPSDLLLIFFANSGVSMAPPEHAHALSRRLIAYLLQSFDTKGHGSWQPLPHPGRMALKDVFDSASQTGRRPLTPPAGP
ncbi:TetR/AcrR family transcriptional regulator [Brevibacterium oceani]|uniref:TetR/AcrR family transcriptional regulator n=1 Tax=Brevibacterium oceani TaxID=358099 RepID=UPI001B330C1F|nr:TetR/AcrR family transcriptional regulator [Brevibacterium oceani]